jgi:hypothetical protein
MSPVDSLYNAMRGGFSRVPCAQPSYHPRSYRWQPLSYLIADILSVLRALHVALLAVAISVQYSVPSPPPLRPHLPARSLNSSLLSGVV